MSQRSQTPLFACLRRAVESARLGEATDRELLERYLADHDSAAFGSLLKRHGQRVLATCRRVLHREADVEDAFQATFLVLLAKARSVRWEPSLGSWLTAVAHRIAVRTRARAAKQAAREAQAQLPETAGRSGDGLLWREASAILHEELDRLPDDFRLPLVLCYLEGQSRDEAAHALGCSLDVVKGRLERGRARLRGRLQRRGVSLSAGLLGALGTSALASSNASASHGPSIRLVQATLRAAATGEFSARVTTLVSGAGSMMTGKCKLFATTVLVLGVLSGVGLWLGAAPPRDEQRSPPQSMRATLPAAADAAKPAEEKKAEPKEDGQEAIEVSGSVLNADGKPSVGARLFALQLKKPDVVTQDDVGTEQVGTAGPEGQFRVSVKTVRGRGYLIASAEGAGIDFVELNGKASPDKVTLKLVADLPIAGRLVDTEGKPVAGVKVGIGMLFVPAEDKLDTYLAGWKKNWRETIATPEKRLYLPLDDIAGAVTSDKEGRFKLTAAGVERIVQLSIRGGGVARSGPYVITRSGFDPKPYNDAAADQERGDSRPRSEQPILYGPELTFVVVRARTMDGTIKDASTGKGLGGFHVSASYGFGDGIATVTDKDGKYHLDGLPQEKTYRVFANPPTGSAYLRKISSAESTPGNTPLHLDFELVKGVVVSGRVLDRQTGKGVQGGVRFAPLPKNKYFDKPGFDGYLRDRTMITTDAEGRFRTTTIPGPSLLMVQAHGQEKAHGLEFSPYMSAVPDPDHKDLFQYQKDDDTWLFTSAGGLELLSIENAVKVVDLKEDSETKVEIFLERGQTAPIVVQDADGKPLTGVVVSGLTAHWPIAFKLNEAAATVYALDPTKPRRLVCVHPEKSLGGTAVVRGDEKEPVVVRLAPLGSVKARFLDTDGATLAGATLTVSCPDEIGRELYRFLERSSPAVKADEAGRFTLSGIVPGMKFYVQTSRGAVYYVGEPKIGLLEVKPGETLDLGEHKLKPVQ